MAEKPRFRRKQYFIKKNYQTKFILKFCLLVLAGVVLSTVLLLSFSQGTLTSTFKDSRLVVTKTSWAIFPAIMYTNLISLGLITLATIAVVLFISHKIAGPMFRFEKELKAIGQGDLTVRIILRKGDQFKDMAESLNQMSLSLHDKVATIDKGLETIIADTSIKPDSQSQKALSALQSRLKQEFKL